MSTDQPTSELTTRDVLTQVDRRVSLIERAIDCHLADQLSFWDALVVVAAHSAGCAFLLSEDLNPGQTVRGVVVVNPAAADALLSSPEPPS